jgi:CCT motif
MSEPWLVDDFRSLSGAGSSMSSNIAEINSPFNLLSDSLSVLVPVSVPNTATSAELQASGNSVPISVPIGIAAWASRKMEPKTALPVAISLSTSTSVNSTAHLQGYGAILPQILEGDYRTVYNKNGRIGIYTREERQSIIRRFQDKRRNRVWKKKIRYHCRKNLADRRVRIKVSSTQSASN